MSTFSWATTCIPGGARGGIEVKAAVEKFVGGKQRVQTGSPHHVEGEFGLWKETVP